MFAIACVAAVIVTCVSVELLKSLWPDADLRRRWHDRPTRRRWLRREWLSFR
jgi:hypothetical protein